MTQDELLAKLPAGLRPWGVTYGPAFLAMTSDEVKAWLERILKGDTIGAYQQVLDKLPKGAFLAEGETLADRWQAQNERNADSIALQKAALTAVVKVLLGIALAAVGL